MKKFIISTLVLISFLSHSQNNGLFYYSFDKTINLTPVPDTYTVEFIDEVDEMVFTNNGFTFEKLTDKLYEVNGDFLAVKNAGNNIYYLNPTYITDSGYEIQMYNKIVLRWKEETNSADKTALINQFNLVEKKTTRLFTIYKSLNPLSISQLVYESGKVKYCHPVFIAHLETFDSVPYSSLKKEKNKLEQPTNILANAQTLPQYIPNDEYFNQQWYLHNTGQELNDGNFGTPDADIDAPEAWMITKGSSNIIVAVIDRGLTFNHPDLPNIRQERLEGSNFLYDYLPYPNNDPNDPNPLLHLSDFGASEYHGNSCAGIIAAEIDNLEGIVGVAPNCRIMPIRATGQYNSSWEFLAEPITFAVDNGANIISCSWGGFTSDPYLNATMIDAIEDAIFNKVIVLFASGNYADNSGISDTHYPPESLPSRVGFPASANIPSLISVGASDRNDKQANYSPTDEKLDICAPSNTDFGIISNEYANIWSLDLPDNYGLNPDFISGELLPSYGTNKYYYTGRFGGTSAATPEVAGVVALMLSVNPCLTPKQVTTILYNTTDKVGGYDYYWNDQRIGHSKELGYGRLNAYKAVSTAQETNSSTLDLYVKDTDRDFGIEPNNMFVEYMWNSPDIWVRNQADGIETHQNPEYDPNNPNYVYIRVINKSCATSTVNEELKLYWAKANTGLSWPNNWNGTYYEDGVLMGDEIGSIQIPILAPGEETIVEFEWNVPNPDDYSGIAESLWNFSLLTRIVSNEDTMTFPEGRSTYKNVVKNNNIALKNLLIVNFDSHNISHLGGVVAISNPFDVVKSFKIELIKEETENGKAIYDESEVRVKLDNNLFNSWSNGGEIGVNYIASSVESEKIVANNNVLFDNIELQPNEMGTLSLRFNFLTEELTDKTKFSYHIIQRDIATNEIVGGKTFEIRKEQRDLFTADAGDDKEIDIDETLTINSIDIDEIATYNWYDTEGNLIYTGKDLTITPEITKKYKLEVIADSDGFKDYDEIEVTVNPFVLHNLIPNPANNQVQINYQVQQANSAYVMLMNISNGISNNYILNTNQQDTTIDLSSYQTGYYEVALICEGQVVAVKTLFKE